MRSYAFHSPMTPATIGSFAAILRRAAGAVNATARDGAAETQSLSQRSIMRLRAPLAYFPARRSNHSTTPVSSPNANSGRINTLDAPDRYATVPNAQHEPTVHKAIARESGSLSMQALSGRCWKEKLLPTPPRPVGVISLTAMSGDSIPIKQMLRRFIARSSAASTCGLVIIASDREAAFDAEVGDIKFILFAMSEPELMK